tara:strand:+ start:1999 stop:2628 length:630 start_codon:yes stop_codon:yes gene_type:complete
MNTRVVMPKCPVCLNSYSHEVKPVVLQPCCHGCCANCVAEYRRISEENNEQDITCPQCREVVIEEKPNYDLIEMLPEQSNRGYWTEKLIELTERRGEQLQVHVDVEVFSKLICLRIIENKNLIKISELQRNDWSNSDQKLIRSIKQELDNCILCLDCEFDEIVKWVQILNLPTSLETYMMSHLLNFYESKKFLQPMGAEWLLDLIPASV